MTEQSRFAIMVAVTTSMGTPEVGNLIRGK